jgi:hypothetical protein
MLLSGKTKPIKKMSMSTFPVSTETQLMPELAQLIDSIKMATLGRKSLKPDYEPSKFYHYFGSVYFFKLVGIVNSCVGFHLPTSSHYGSEGHIVIVHKPLNEIKEDIEQGERKIAPDVIITFRQESSGTIQTLMGGQGSRRIDMIKLGKIPKEFLILLGEEMDKKVRAYNYRMLKSKRTKQKK